MLRQADVSDYIATLTHDLSLMAEAKELEVLAFTLRMAEVEARQWRSQLSIRRSEEEREQEQSGQHAPM